MSSSEILRKQKNKVREFYISRPYFWDRAHHHYRDQNLRTHELSTLASDIGVHADAITKWFANQRTLYLSYKKDDMERLEYGKQPIVSEGRLWTLANMDFLADHIKPRKPKKSKIMLL